MKTNMNKGNMHEVAFTQEPSQKRVDTYTLKNKKKNNVTIKQFFHFFCRKK